MMIFDKTMTDAEVEKAIADRAKDMSFKLNMLFFARITGLAGTLMTLITYYSTFYTRRMNSAVGPSSEHSIVIDIVSLVIAVMYGAVVLRMGEYYDELKVAGICYIVSGVVIVLIGITEYVWLVIPAAILLLVYIMKFAEAMKQSLYGIDSKISDCWNILMLIYKTLFGLVAAFFILANIPWAFIWAIRIVLLIIIGIVIAAIYELTVLKLTANSMSRFCRSKTSRKKKSISKENG